MLKTENGDTAVGVGKGKSAKTWVERSRDRIPVLAKVFFLIKIFVNMFHLVSKFIALLYHVNDVIFVPSSAVKCGNVTFFK